LRLPSSRSSKSQAPNSKEIPKLKIQKETSALMNFAGVSYFRSWHGREYFVIPSRVDGEGSRVRSIGHTTVACRNASALGEVLACARDDSDEPPMRFPLWFKCDRYDQSPLAPRCRTPVMKSRDGSLVERWITRRMQRLNRNGMPICIEYDPETARSWCCSTLSCLRRITRRRCVNQF